MAAVEQFPEKIFLWSQQQIAISPYASQYVIPAAIGAPWLRRELPFGLREALRLEQQIGLTALYLLNAESGFAGCSRQKLKLSWIGHGQSGRPSTERRRVSRKGVTGGFQSPSDSFSRLIVGRAKPLSKNGYQPVADPSGHFRMVREDLVKHVSVKSPQDRVELRVRGGGPRSGVNQSHLPEEIAGIKACEHDIYLTADVLADHHLALLHDV